MTPPMTQSPPLKEQLQALRELRDETRLEVHLAGMELKQRLEKLEPLIEQAEKLASDVSSASERAIAEIFQALKNFRESVRQQRSLLKK